MAKIRKKSFDYLSDINEKKLKAAWKLNFAIMIVLILSISAVAIMSFRTISTSIQNNFKRSSIQLVKQTTRNIETVLSNIDKLSVAMTSDGVLANLVKEYTLSNNEHEKAECFRQIQEIMNIHAVNRDEIADMVVVTESMEYITSGELTTNETKDVTSHNAVKLFQQSGEDSLWINTYVSDASWTHSSTGSFGQVVSFVKKIYMPKSKESYGMLIINYKESYLYRLISDVNVPKGSEIFVLGNNGDNVMNIYDRSSNGYYSDCNVYLADQATINEGSIRRTIGKEDYIVTIDSIDQINETPVKWRVVLITAAEFFTSGITDIGMKIFFLGLVGVTFGFVFTVLLIKRYSFSADKKYTKRHSIMMEQERLASLGQLIGGIAHNFKTPIMSISGGIEAIKDLAIEYDRSIEDESVNEKDHHEIASEMRSWVKKSRSYCSYMSDIISAVKGQAVNCNRSSMECFIIKDFINRVKILMNHELKKNKCHMNIDLRVDESTEIRGEINNLVQVMNNLISNSIEAYDGKPGDIDVILDINQKNLEIVVKDYGSGIPEKVKHKLLKEMITTKGDKGTGIGLYMSYSTIKGKFAGNMRIESEEGKGTSIKIRIPLPKK